MISMICSEVAVNEAWVLELESSWIEAKQTTNDKSANDKSIPVYLGVSSIEEVSYEQAQLTLDATRARAETLLAF